jgi:3-oxoadipate enol-lactonase
VKRRPLLHHRVLGPIDAPLLVLGPSLGTSTTVWDPHVAVLAESHRVLCYDLPGHGGSPSDLVRDHKPGRTTVGDLAHMVLDLVAHQGRDRFHYAGISLGGGVGVHLALHQPDHIASLALVCSSAYFGPPQFWQERAALVRREGTGALLEAMPGRWFADPGTASTSLGKTFLQDLATADPIGYAACCEALAVYDVRRDLRRITAPTLVLNGSQDTATPLPHARELAEGISGAKLVTVDTGHLAVEEPQAVGAALLAHLRMAGGAEDADRSS